MLNTAVISDLLFFFIWVCLIPFLYDSVCQGDMPHSWIFWEEALQKQRQCQQCHIQHCLWGPEGIAEEFINISLALENEEVENEEVENEEDENEEDVVDHSSVFMDPQSSSADVMVHPVTIHDDDDDVIQQSFSSASASRLSCYLLWFWAISLVSDQSSTSGHVTVPLSSSNSETQAGSETEISKEVSHHSAIQSPSAHTFAAQQLHASWASQCSHGMFDFIIPLPLHHFFLSFLFLTFRCWLLWDSRALFHEFEHWLLSSPPHTILEVTFSVSPQWSSLSVRPSLSSASWHHAAIWQCLEWLRNCAVMKVSDRACGILHSQFSSIRAALSFINHSCRYTPSITLECEQFYCSHSQSDCA